MTNPKPRGRTILLVEDDFDIRDALASVLADEGYTVSGAANGQEALEILRQNAEVQLIVLDLMMPVMDGWTFRSVQRGDPRIASIPVIVLSAHGGSNEQVNTLGPVAFLRKPVQLDVLLATVAEHVPPA